MINKYTQIVVGGVVYDAVFSYTAKMEIDELLNDKPGDKAYDLIDSIMEINTEQDWFRFIQMVHVLVCSAELAKRAYGMEPSRIPSLSELRYAVMPAEVPEMQKAVMEAITKGLTRETQDEEVDLIMAEINKNRKITRSESMVILLNLGLSLTDADRVYPGVVYDIAKIKHPDKVENETSGDVEE